MICSAEHFKDRTDVQCLHRWQKVLNPELVKGPWTKEEDEELIRLVEKYSAQKWSCSRMCGPPMLPDDIIAGEITQTPHQDTSRWRRNELSTISDLRNRQSTRKLVNRKLPQQIGAIRVEEEKGKDLQKPYKEVVKLPFTRQIIEFLAPNHQMPTNMKIYDGSTDLDDHVTHFVGAANQGEWQMPVGRRFLDSIPKMVTENMRRVDDFVKSEEAYKSTKLLRGEFLEKRKGTSHWETGHTVTRGMKTEGKKLTISAWMLLPSGPKEILATKLQLQVPLCPPMIRTPNKENLNRYCDYHKEKGHYTNNCYQLKRLLEAAFESRKLSHLVKDVRQ
ncbi:reverse transcriptase domain-containing protein [Tanacetum coccineum]